MIVPQFWAEAKSRKVIDGRQVTIKRFGWSDENQSQAQAHAQSRVNEAMALAESGEKIRKIDHKVPYNGAEGLPIREEIISRYRDSVITRNSYGALCINTPDVMFADIDFVSEPSLKHYCAAFLILFGLSFIGAVLIKSWPVLIVLFFISIIFTTSFALWIFRFISKIRGDEDKISMEKIQKFSNQNPKWHLRIYKTPKGLRVLVMHKTFSTNEDEAIDFLKKLNSDSIYVQMCKNQNCFRARVSPKPWRIGISRLGPRPGVWPIKEERMSDRKKWVEKYEKVANRYASCRFREKIGSDAIDAKAEFIRSVHDKYCRADSDLKIA